MIYVLLVCAMTTGGWEVCSDVGKYPTKELCQEAKDKKQPADWESYRCEARKTP